MAEFRVECQCQQVAFTDRNHSTVIQTGKCFHSRTQVLDIWSAYENRVKRLTPDIRDGKVGFKAVHLPARGVAPDFDVHQAKSLKVAFGDFIGEKNHSSARAHYRDPRFRHLLEGFYHMVMAGEFEDRRAFAARDYQAVEPREFSRGAHFNRLDTQTAQGVEMLDKSPLECQNSYFHTCHL